MICEECFACVLNYCCPNCSSWKELNKCSKGINEWWTRSLNSMVLSPSISVNRCVNYVAGSLYLRYKSAAYQRYININWHYQYTRWEVRQTINTFIIYEMQVKFKIPLTKVQKHILNLGNRKHCEPQAEWKRYIFYINQTTSSVG